MIRAIAADAKITDNVRLEAIEAAIPFETIQAVVQDHQLQRQRQRKLSAEMGLMIAIAMNLFSHLSLEQVLYKLIQGLRFVWPDPQIVPASKGAISQMRYAVGAGPIVDLFRRVCRPMTPAHIPGAFLWGLRLMAIDGTIETIPDTPDNEQVFGRHTSGRGVAGYPQVQAVYLEEVGAHAVVDAGVWPVHTSERVGGLRLLRSVTAGMLVMWDAGFHSFEMVRRTLANGAQFLGRLPAGVKPLRVARLPDGSCLVELTHASAHGRILQRLRVRMISYTVTDPALPGYGCVHRLVTSLLDWQQFPAFELAQAFHQRWEIEITIDETDTHQRQALHPLRSQKPVGVIQELYGLLVAHYAVRKVMLAAAEQARVDPDRISFVNALRLIGEAIPQFQQTAAADHPRLYQRLLTDIAHFRLPPRKARTNPRVVKRKMSNFEKKGPKHNQCPQPKGSFADAIQILN